MCDLSLFMYNLCTFKKYLILHKLYLQTIDVSCVMTS